MTTSPNKTVPKNILLTGATGYVGGRLVPLLLDVGYQVRCLVRDPARLQGRPWLDEVGIYTGDVLQPDSLLPALTGVEVAYYLIHSMAGRDDFHERDIQAAHNFGQAAKAAGVKRIIYLGGLVDPHEPMSKHLESRQQTGETLRESGVPVTEFRAAAIIGSGSLSFELVRYLTERLPVMVCPKWVYTCTHPIGIREVLQYLVAAISTPASAGQIIEIGGSEVLTYREMMLGYAEARGLRRWLVPVPLLTPRLSSYWVDFVTPLPATIARPLIEGLRNELVVRSDLARQLFPQITPVDYKTSVNRTLVRLDTGKIETAWSDALVTSQGDVTPVTLKTEAGMNIERRQRIVNAPPEVVFATYTGIGGAKGWPNFNWAWRVRGWLDQLVGGVGLRRGRRDPVDLRAGDALDFWRVEEIEKGRMLRLRAEMKVPGRAWLQFESQPLPDGKTLLVQTALFAPKGLFGFLYWYAIYPLHGFIFSGMVQELAWQAEAQELDALPPAAQRARQRQQRLKWAAALLALATMGLVLLLWRRR